MRKLGVCAVAAVVLAILAGCGGSKPAAKGVVAGRVPPSATLQTQPTTAPVVVAPAPEAAYCPPEPLPAFAGVAGKTVILDAGHGGHDEGTSHFGLREKDINLDLALRTAGLLRARGCNVILTRSADQFIPLPDRSAIANRNPNAAFVSIHVNAAPNNPSAAGIETFVLAERFSNQERGRIAAERYRANGQDSIQGRQALANLAVESRTRGPALAASLQRSLCGRLGEPDRGVKQKDLAVLRETYFGPAALVEVGFLTNPRSAEKMRTGEWRGRTAEALAEGIANFLGGR